MIKERFNQIFFPHDNKSSHFKSLDGLRGLAVLLVLLSHTSNVNLFFHEYINFTKIGKVGVYLFFVLSAYLLDRQIALAFMTNKSSKGYWKNYFLRRFLRIYPLFVLALIFHGLLTYVGTTTVIDQANDIPLHMLLMKGESIFWSIPVEFKYYFLSPIIMWFCHKYFEWNRNYILYSFLFLIMFSIVAQVIFRFPNTSTFRFLPIFLVGTIISIYELLYKDKIKKLANPKLFTIAGIVSLGVIILTIPFYFEKIFGVNINFHASVFYFPYAILWGIILLAAKYGNGIVQSILEIKLLRFIGTISFSMYLFHMLVLDYLLVVDIPNQFKIYVFFFITIIISTVSYLLIEQPLSKIRIHSNNLNEKEFKKELITKETVKL